MHEAKVLHTHTHNVCVYTVSLELSTAFAQVMYTASVSVPSTLEAKRQQIPDLDGGNQPGPQSDKPVLLYAEQALQPLNGPFKGVRVGFRTRVLKGIITHKLCFPKLVSD